MSEKLRPGQKLKLTTVDELLGVPNGESATEIEISKIVPFKEHPFKVLDDDKMKELVESVRINGVLTPVLVRQAENGMYEMISGHRRMHAAKLAELTLIPAIIRDMTDDEATIAMVDANIQREELLPSERAFAFKMKMDAMRHQGERKDLTSGNDFHRSAGEKSSDVIGREVGLSGRNVRNYIRLTELIPDLLTMVDDKKLQFTVAVEISYLNQQLQQWILGYIRNNGAVKMPQITRLRRYVSQNEKITEYKMIELLNGAAAPKGIPRRTVMLKEDKLFKYFPSSYSEEEMEKVIVGLLEKWSQEGSV